MFRFLGHLAGLQDFDRLNYVWSVDIPTLSGYDVLVPLPCALIHDWPFIIVSRPFSDPGLLQIARCPAL